MIVVNGAVRHLAAQAARGDTYPLKQRSHLFRNDGRGRFIDVSDAAGPAFSQLQVGRGVATGDLDNDGGVDVAVFNNSGPARVLMNQVGSTRHWLGVRVLDRRHPREALQSRVTLVGPAGRDMTRVVRTDGSYASASDPRVVFGLGADAAARTIRVQWPGGPVEEFRGLAVDRVLGPGARKAGADGCRGQGSERLLAARWTRGHRGRGGACRGGIERRRPVEPSAGASRDSRADWAKLTADSSPGSR